jgi:hypothetical protein
MRYKKNQVQWKLRRKQCFLWIDYCHGIVSPEVGRWYRRLNGNLFEVVAVDEVRNTVELQHFDGTIEGVDIDVWADIDLEPAQAPEDWSGSVDIDWEDLPEPENPSNMGWHNPLSFLDSFE